MVGLREFRPLLGVVGEAIDFPLLALNLGANLLLLFRRRRDVDIDSLCFATIFSNFNKRKF